ncbi:MAG: hypothetical protein HC939_11845 [Pleurocapsa sp. SU_5_0]|jgi:hypothetical protein|nr:hypothetical protein [Pleurocapsa sp. SU_5_0]NJO95242.1 hypothetical protein [Pleurocapsa sp. CRU_1_2]NJR44494.1 hypothetical protein [Hyellaceae cyanobacterium CSU_1_1]
MITNEMKRHFCIFDYFLDGEYLKWEEIEYECPVFIAGQRWTVDLEDGTQVTGEIIETVSISENERRIMLRSC